MTKEEESGRPVRVGVLMGGASSERDISLKSGTAVVEALRQAGYDVVPLDVPGDDEAQVGALLKNAFIDVAFIALHGAFGEDGVVQRLLQHMGIPYTGSDMKASATAINKPLTQSILRKNGLCVPDFLTLRREQKISLNEILRSLNGLPVVVKPANEGSSIGVTIVREEAALGQAIEQAFDFGQEILVDRYVQGRELTVGIIDGEALPVVEIRPCSGAFFDFDSKYRKGATDYLVPAPLPETMAVQVRQAALDAFQALGCRDFARVDFILDKEQLYILEINTIPGFTATSLLPMAAAKAGMDFEHLCGRIVAMALARRTNVELSEDEQPERYSHHEQDRS